MKLVSKGNLVRAIVLPGELKRCIHTLKNRFTKTIKLT